MARIKSLEEYQQLWDRAAADPPKFWGELAARSCTGSSRSTKALRVERAVRQVVRRRQDQRFATTASTPIVADGRGDDIAIIWEGEPGDQRTLTYAELHREVCKFANVLKTLGVGQGDVVSIYMPMMPELAIAMLACARIGAVHSVIFAGFSAEAIADRNNDASAKLQITADGGWRRGKVAAAEGDRRRGAREVAHGREVRRARADRRRGAHAGGPRLLVARADATTPRPTAPPSRWTARPRCSSSTPAARPANRRASSTPRPATTCTPRRRSSGCSTTATTTSSGARPTAAGSPATATSSTARCRPARRC